MTTEREQGSMPANTDSNDDIDEDITNESKPVKASDGQHVPAASSDYETGRTADKSTDGISDDTNNVRTVLPNTLPDANGGGQAPNGKDHAEDDEYGTQHEQYQSATYSSTTVSQQSREFGVHKPQRPISDDDLPDLRETDSTENDGQNRNAALNHDEFTTVYDVIDELDGMLENAKSGILSPNMAKIDREEFSNKLGALKTMLPVQLERASSLMREAERRLNNAQAQAKSIVAEARSTAVQTQKEAEEQAQFLASHERVTQLAQERARSIVADAQAQATKLVQGADGYCSSVMGSLQEQLTKYGNDVANGINVLKQREEEAARQLSQTQTERNQTVQSDRGNGNSAQSASGK